MKKIFLFCFFIFLFIFSYWLMNKSFSYDPQKQQILVGSKIWSDYAAHLPLIRSFSYGQNWPPEFPLFPGLPIKYHFLFYLLVGLLERIGLRIDLALNLLSGLSFFLLLLIIYLLAKYLFNSRKVGLLSVIFFLFNGTLSFLEFFKAHPFSTKTLTDIWTLTNYPSFMPYGQGEVAAFWSLNTFVNQRHLALTFFIILLTVYVLLKHQQEKPLSLKGIFCLSILLGLLPSIHKATFAMSAVVLAFMLLFFSKIRKDLIKIGLLTALIALPQLLSTSQSQMLESNLSFYPGYLVHGQSLILFIRHWVMNLGLSVIFIPLGFILAPRQAKKVFLCFLPLFFIGNLVKFTPEIAANHKFFNLFIIIGNMFTAYALVWSFRSIRHFFFPFSFFLFLSNIFWGYRFYGQQE